MSQDPNEQPSPGMSFFAEIAKAMSSKGPVQWDVARQFAMMTATSSTSEGNVDPAVRISVQQLAAVADMHVRDVTGLTTTNTMKVPEIDVVNRSMWVHHTLEAYKPLFTEFATSIYGQTLINPNSVTLENTPDLSADVPNELNEMISNLTKMMAPAMLGMSVGSMIGQLALRAFGQYDLPLPRDPATQLLFVARNCEEFARDWSINVTEMQMWLLVQELTFHAVFKVPHIREAITIAVKNHVAGFRPNPDALADRLGTMDITSSDPAVMMQRLLTDPTLLIGAVRSPGQEALAPILDAMISSVVSYVDHIVDTVAGRILGTGDQIAEAVRRRRVEAGDQDQFVEQLLGLHLTTFQIDRGHEFIAGVIERAGTEGLTGLWKRAGNLPTPNEIVAPGLWLERINY
ncbi:MAG: zinc-dependent metalloprotease [Acidimicrobiaceae bacterium]|nr:zinc-dependent metalloprotease [Acidimicrobiaceae bacterium]